MPFSTAARSPPMHAMRRRHSAIAGAVFVVTDGEQERFEVLLAAACAGSRDASEELFRLALRHFESWIHLHPTARRFQARYVDSDLFQEAALRAWQRLPTAEAKSIGEFLAWFDEILRHKEAELLRHDFSTKKRDCSREVPLDGDGAQRISPREARSNDVDPCARASRCESASALDEALHDLPPPEQRVVELRYWEGLSYREIGSLLGQSAEAVRSTLRRALRRLREKLETDNVP